ncbi:MAG: hypothetical protein AAF466_13150 [Bacteroidota bacterium]
MRSFINYTKRSLMGQWIYKLCLIILIWSLQKANVELSFVVSVLITAVTFRKRLSSLAALFIVFLLSMVLVGSVTVFNPENDYYFFTKDLIYFLRPVFLVLAGYFITMRLDNKREFLNILVLMGFYFALMHLFKIVVNYSIIPLDTNRMRTFFGRYNHVETIALVLIICVKELPMKRSRFKFFYQIMVACLVLSFILYFSRTMIMVVFAMSLAYYGYFRLNQRGAVALSILLVLGSAFALFLSTYQPESEAGQGMDFLGKIKNSFSESFTLGNVDITSKDRRELWKHWRAYEASVVYKEVADNGQYLLGEGFGSTIDIGFEAKLDGEMTQHLSLTHNGFAYLYMKNGIMGLFIYFLMTLYLYSFAYSRKNKDPKVNIGNNILVACTFYILISSFVVTGIFKPYDMATLLIGGAFALKQTNYFEDRNTRNEGEKVKTGALKRIWRNKFHSLAR